MSETNRTPAWTESDMRAFLRNVEALAAVVESDGELDEPEQFRADMLAARAFVARAHTETAAAASARAQAIEECAKVCDAQAQRWVDFPAEHHRMETYIAAAHRIRALSPQRAAGSEAT